MFSAQPIPELTPCGLLYNIVLNSFYITTVLNFSTSLEDKYSFFPYILRGKQKRPLFTPEASTVIISSIGTEKTEHRKDR